MSDAPERLDCQGALDRLYEYLDGELTTEVEAAVRTHLTACAPCFRLFGFEGAFLRFLEARTRAQDAPDALKRRVLDSLLLPTDDAESE